MQIADADVDWEMWFKRWQVQQDCYVPQRGRRFELMLQRAGLPEESYILNIGSGPGALALAALEHCPKARVVAVDYDPVLLAIGEQVAEARAVQVDFLRADLRESAWWAEYEGQFDLVVSATALHWLTADNLSEMYGRVHGALKPGAWFTFSDHLASDDDEMQARHRAMLLQEQETAFRETGALTWDAFWEELGRELGQGQLDGACDEAGFWEGSGDGYPLQFHLDALSERGFERAQVLWQQAGEAVIGARKPVATAPPHQDQTLE
jgi:SAM-dependent methyltransferase